MDCNPPGSSVHRVFQARILDWIAISFSRESSRTRDQTHVYYIGRQVLYHWATGKMSFYKRNICNNKVDRGIDCGGRGRRLWGQRAGFSRDLGKHSAMHPLARLKAHSGFPFSPAVCILHEFLMSFSSRPQKETMNSFSLLFHLVSDANAGRKKKKKTSRLPDLMF